MPGQPALAVVLHPAKGLAGPALGIVGFSLPVSPCRLMVGVTQTMGGLVWVGCLVRGPRHSGGRCPQKLGLVIWVTVHVVSSTSSPP